MRGATEWNLQNDPRIPDCCSQYAVVFDNSSLIWTDDMDANERYVKRVEGRANARYNDYDRVTLDYVLRVLNILDVRTSICCAIGWDKASPQSDGFVDFILFKGPDYIVIDFNVDGIIFA